MKTIDRYLLRELSFPFVIALIGFLIFILLNLILGLRDFMLDRSIGLWTILQLLGYQLPFFLVLSLPVATLFAIFLALGRLAHDHELIALQASGLSLKRIVLPILILSIFISGFDLFLNDRMVPWANYRYQSLIRQLIFRQSVPQVQDNTFFRDSEGRFFYVKRYDRESGRLQGIMIYDLAGAEYLPELGGRYPKVIVAEEGSWDGEVWQLRDGVIHKYDDRGHLEYELRFESLAINVGEGLEQLFLTSRTPQEMSLGELARKIRALREGGLRAEGLIVEYHSKISIPLAGLVFALFGAPLSLIFSTRSRAAGIVIAVLLVGLFQGSLIWAETLGKRGIIPPALSAWLPNLLFGSLGLILFSVMDRISQLDLRERLRRVLPFTLIILGLSLVSFAEELPRLEITADSLTLSEDWNAVNAEGHVVVRYGESSIAAQRLELSRADPFWEVSARREIELRTNDISATGEKLQAKLVEDDAGRLSLTEAELVGFSGESHELRYIGGRAHLLFGEGLDQVKLSAGAQIEYRGGSLQAEEIIITKGEGDGWIAEAQGEVALEEEGRTTTADHLELRFDVEGGGFHAEVARVDSFSGEGSFINSRGEEHLLRYQGRRATLSFDEENRVKVLNIAQGSFTTCVCSEVIEKDAYCIDADRVLIFSDDLLVATDITLRAFGLPIFWYPLYLAPLQEERKSPLLPELGRSGARGWYAKWRLPFIWDERNYGFILLDYFNRYRQFGGGVDLSYDLLGNSGSLRLYKLFGPQGLLELALSDRTALPQGTMLNLSANYRSTVEEEAEGEWMGYRARLTGRDLDWQWAMDFSHDRYVGKPKEGEELRYRQLERLPEFSLTRRAGSFGLFNYSFGLSWGRYRERKLGEGGLDESTRFAGTLGLNLSELSFLDGRLRLRAGGGYRISLYGSATRMEVLTWSPSLNLLPFDGLNLSLSESFRLVWGESPFAFDREERLHRFDLKGNLNLGDLRGSFQAAYDLEKGRFSPLTVDLNYHIGLSRTSLGLSYDLGKNQLQRLTIREVLSGKGWSFSANTGYDFRSGRFADLIAKLALQDLKLGLRFDLNGLSLKRLSGELSLELGEDWALSLAGEYDLPGQRLVTFQYGLVRSFCRRCWEIGLYGNQGRWWLQARINAFPTAAIKYSPSDRGLSFGD